MQPRRVQPLLLRMDTVLRRWLEELVRFVGKKERQGIGGAEVHLQAKSWYGMICLSLPNEPSWLTQKKKTKKQHKDQLPQHML